MNNFVSGLIVLLERPIHLGDSIQMGDVAGEVQRIGIRSTTVRTGEGAEVIVPNASLVAEKVTNWTLSDRRRHVDVPVNVAYGSAPEKVLDLLRGVAASSRFDRWVEVRSELGVAVYAALHEAGIEIPFPQREVRLRQGEPS